MSEQWTILKLLNWTQEYFGKKGLENPRLDAELLLCDILHCERVALYVNFDRPMDAEELTQYREYVTRRGQMEPLAYILGHREFMYYDFYVNKDVLIPRPETELLVEHLVDLFKDEAGLNFLDIGTGSGAIALSLLQLLPTSHAVALDISAGALAVAQRNAENMGLVDRVELVQSDVFNNLAAAKQFNFIVSNPPYIPQKEEKLLAADVLREPHNALFAGIDGLDIYREIIKQATGYLQDDGVLAFEIGHGQGAAVAELCREQKLNITKICYDYAGLERMVFATGDASKYGNQIMELTTK